jgi:hypothetical protein
MSLGKGVGAQEDMAVQNEVANKKAYRNQLRIQN